MEEDWNAASSEKRVQTFVALVRAIVFNGEAEDCAAALHKENSEDFEELLDAFQEEEQNDAANNDDENED